MRREVEVVDAAVAVAVVAVVAAAGTRFSRTRPVDSGSRRGHLKTMSVGSVALSATWVTGARSLRVGRGAKGAAW